MKLLAADIGHIIANLPSVLSELKEEKAKFKDSYDEIVWKKLKQNVNVTSLLRERNLTVTHATEFIADKVISRANIRYSKETSCQENIRIFLHSIFDRIEELQKKSEATV